MSPGEIDEAALCCAIVESSGDAIISHHIDGTIKTWNAAAARVFGFTAADAVGQSIHIIVPNARQAEHDDIVTRVGGGDFVEHFETVRSRKDGTRVVVSLTVAPLRSPGGEVIGVATVARSVSGRDRGERAVRRLAAIIESSEDAIVSKNLDGVVTSWNRAAERMFGYSASEMVGESVRTIVPVERQAEEDHVLAQIRRGDRVDHFETIRRRKDGTLVPVSLTVSPIRDGEGKVVGASKIARDISDRKQAEVERVRLLTIAQEHAAEIARLYIGLQEAARLKDEFLATLSHELRTPLNAILGYARMIRSGFLVGDKQQRAVETIERNATSLSQIVEDVLDVSRIITGKIRLNVQPVELVDVIRNALESVTLAAGAKGIDLAADLDAETGPVSGDAERLQQVVWNLVSNAVKFTPRGGKVHVRLARVDANVEIVVSDTGAGIALDFLPHVFERFRQADASTTRERGGLGLGLAVSRHFVELHGGTIHVASGGVGQGSTFRINLPLMIAHKTVEQPRMHPEQQGAGTPIAVPDLRGVHVLAIDDDVDALNLVREILEAAGARVSTVASAIAALEVFETERPDVVVADLGLPHMDGFELIKRIRGHADDETRRTPAAALTAYARSEDRVKALRSGFQMHLSKPIDPVVLMAAVAVLARRSGVAHRV